MFESFGFGKKLPSSDKRSSEEIKQDTEISAEIDEIGKEEDLKTHKELGHMISKMASDMELQRKEAYKIMNCVNGYLVKNVQNINRGIPLDDFIDFVDGTESGFDSDAIALMGSWVNKYNGEINPEKPLGDFLDFVKKKAEEANFLLHPESKKEVKT